MFHIFSLVCFLIYGVKSRSGHDRSQSFGPISHVSGPEMTFWNDFIVILHGCYEIEDGEFNMKGRIQDECRCSLCARSQAIPPH